MTAVLAAAARAVAASVLVLAVLAAMLWPAYGPQGAWKAVWVAAVYVVVTGAVLALAALAPRKGGGPSADA